MVQSNVILTFPKRQILDSSKLKESQTTILSFMKMAESSPKGWKTLLEKEKFSLRAISSFPTVFSKGLYCRHQKTKA